MPKKLTSTHGSTSQVLEAIRRGRPRGYSYLAADRPLLCEMQTIIAAAAPGSMSPHKAASLVAQRAIGGGSVLSKQTRLTKEFRMNRHELQRSSTN